MFTRTIVLRGSVSKITITGRSGGGRQGDLKGRLAQDPRNAAAAASLPRKRGTSTAPTLAEDIPLAFYAFERAIFKVAYFSVPMHHPR